MKVTIEAPSPTLTRLASLLTAFADLYPRGVVESVDVQADKYTLIFAEQP